MPFRRITAFILSSIILSAKGLEGNARRRSTDCSRYNFKSSCNNKSSCEWKYDEYGFGYCTERTLETWMVIVIVIGAVGFCIFLCGYTLYQRRRRAARRQGMPYNGQTHQAQPAVALQTLSNPVAPTVSHGQQGYTQPPQQAYAQPYNARPANYNPAPSYSGGPTYGAPPPAYGAGVQSGFV